jgi:hypothetical protein
MESRDAFVKCANTFLARRSRTCKSTLRRLKLMRPPQATSLLCNFTSPIHWYHPRSYIQTLLYHQLCSHRLPSQMRIPMFRLPFDPLHASWTKCARTAVTLQIRSAGGGNGVSRHHAPPRGTRFVWALSNSRATRGLMCLTRVFLSQCLH